MYEQLLPHGFRLSDLTFDRVPFQSCLDRSRVLGRDGASASTRSFPGTFEMLFSRSLTIARGTPTRDEVLKSAIVFELYGMLDAAYDVLQVFGALVPPSSLEEGADALMPDE